MKERKKLNLQFILTACMLFVSTTCLAEKPTAKHSKTNKTQNPSQNEPAKIDAKSSGDGYIATSSTKIDFTETAIDGQMKSPEGFMLQGQQGNSMSQMVKLRSNFRNELNNSKSATKAIVK